MKFPPATTYGFLKPLIQYGRQPNGDKTWLCRCLNWRDSKPCGRSRVVTTANLRSGRVDRCHECGRDAMRVTRKRPDLASKASRMESGGDRVENAPQGHSEPSSVPVALPCNCDVRLYCSCCGSVWLEGRIQCRFCYSFGKPHESHGVDCSSLHLFTQSPATARREPTGSGQSRSRWRHGAE